jgi:hypothetical protein
MFTSTANQEERMAKSTIIPIPETAHEIIREKSKIIKDANYAINKAHRDIEIARNTIFNVIDEALPEHRNKDYRYDEEAMTIEIRPKKERPSLLDTLLKNVSEGK